MVYENELGENFIPWSHRIKDDITRWFFAFVMLLNYCYVAIIPILKTLYYYFFVIIYYTNKFIMDSINISKNMYRKFRNKNKN